MVTPQPPLLNDASHALAMEFEGIYTAYDLGPVPGLGDKRLGGCAVKPGDPSKLLVTADAELPAAHVYEIGVTRDQCGHITGFVGTATELLAVPNADATIVPTSSGNLLFPIYPLAKVSQVETTGWTVTDTWSLSPAMEGWTANWIDGRDSAGGLAFVPASIVPGAKLRALGYPEGSWVHIDLATKAGDPALYDFQQATDTGIVLPNGPGGFAYVPAGSPGFEKSSIIVTEWLMGAVGPDDWVLGNPQKVTVYEVDASGDPIVNTRKEFFSSFNRPWGAYFEEVTGDFMFLSWALAPDHITQVRGFAKPPPPPPPG